LREQTEEYKEFKEYEEYKESGIAKTAGLVGRMPSHQQDFEQRALLVLLELLVLLPHRNRSTTVPTSVTDIRLTYG